MTLAIPNPIPDILEEYCGCWGWANLSFGLFDITEADGLITSGGGCGFLKVRLNSFALIAKSNISFDLSISAFLSLNLIIVYDG